MTSAESDTAPTVTSYLTSPYQHLLWSLHAIGPDFVTSGEFLIEGCPDGNRLRAAFGQLTLRHGALRSSLVSLTHAPFVVQQIHSAATGHGILLHHDDIGGGRHRLTLRAPSAVLDPPSLQVMAAELAAVLTDTALSADPVQFAEFSDWRNDVETPSRHQAYESRPVPAVVHRADRTLTPAQLDLLRIARDSTGVEPADHLLTAWLIHRWRVDGATAYVAVDGRAGDPSLRDVVGRAVHYGRVDIDLSADLPFAVAADRASSARAAAERRAERTAGPAAAAVFDVTPADVVVAIGPVRVVLRGVDGRTEPATHRFVWVPGSGAVALEVTVGSGSRSSVERSLDTILTLAMAALRDPATPLDRLPAVGPLEQVWLAQVAHGPVRPVQRTALDAIVGAASAHPERLAVRDGNDELTYRALTARAAAVAQALRAGGTARGDAVVVIAPRSVWSLVAVLGVMWAGAAYVPLDEDTPPERLRRILEDCRARIVLAGSAAQVPNEVAWLDPATVPSTAAPPPAVRAPGDPVYILFTSGSTGRPKGVVVSDLGLANYVGWAAEHYAMAGPGEAVVSSPFGFDLTVTTWLAPLTVGGTVLISRSTAPLDVLVDLDPARGVGVLKLTPRHVEMLASEGGPDALQAVGTVVIGGEPLDAATVERWRCVSATSLVVNEYGPTETVVGSCYHDVADPTEGSASGSVGVPIGRPIDNTALHVLDNRLRPIPCGATGELYIAGAGVAHGYLNAPADTAVRFLPDPFSAGGARMYRTGDLVRRHHDGLLTFVGRTDDQVKIRGFRVEPGEVERVLSMIDGVRSAIVVPSGQALVAVVRVDTPLPDDATLLRRAALHLPAHMTPARIVRVRDYPLTPNGKIDRLRLALQVRAGAESSARPQTELEQEVARVWQDVLDRDRVGIDESFFEAGGDSLLAIELMRRLQERFDRSLRVMTLFEHPTVRGLAAHLATGEINDAGAPLQPEAVRAGADRAGRRAEARARRGPGRRP